MMIRLNPLSVVFFVPEKNFELAIYINPFSSYNNTLDKEFEGF